MVKQNAASLDRTFAALADPTRRAMLRRLGAGDCTVGELAGPFAMSLAAVSKHLRVLERASLLTQQPMGRARWCHLEAGPLDEVADWLRQRQADEPAAPPIDALASLLGSQPPDND